MCGSASDDSDATTIDGQEPLNNLPPTQLRMDEYEESQDDIVELKESDTVYIPPAPRVRVSAT